MTGFTPAAHGTKAHTFVDSTTVGASHNGARARPGYRPDRKINDSDTALTALSRSDPLEPQPPPAEMLKKQPGAERDPLPPSCSSSDSSEAPPPQSSSWSRKESSYMAAQALFACEDAAAAFRSRR